MTFVLLINLKSLTNSNSFLLNIAEQLLLAFSYLLAEKIPCSAELSMKKSFITSGLDQIPSDLGPV